MERELLGKLEKWKNRKRLKPLIIKGARQVGKTWIMKEFGKRFFENVAYINCDNNENVRNIFEMDYHIPRIISALQVETHQRFLFFRKSMLLIHCTKLKSRAFGI